MLNNKILLTLTTLFFSTCCFADPVSQLSTQLKTTQQNTNNAIQQTQATKNQQKQTYEKNIASLQQEIGKKETIPQAIQPSYIAPQPVQTSQPSSTPAPAKEQAQPSNVTGWGDKANKQSQDSGSSSGWDYGL